MGVNGLHSMIHGFYLFVYLSLLSKAHVEQSALRMLYNLDSSENWQIWLTGPACIMMKGYSIIREE